MAKTKLTPGLCYMAGLFSKGPRDQKNFVCINTNMEALQQRFTEIAVNDLKIAPYKIILGRESSKSVGFYHSRVAKQLMDLIKREVYVFKTVNEFSKSYVAGMFDISGHITQSTVEIRHITSIDAMMLENLGIHSKGDQVRNITKFMALIKGHSLLAESSSLIDE